MKFIKWFAIFTLPFLIAIFVIRAANGIDGLPSMPSILSVFSRIQFHGIKEFTTTLKTASDYLSSFQLIDWSGAETLWDTILNILSFIGNFYIGIGYVFFAVIKLIGFTLYDLIQVLTAIWAVITLPNDAILTI